MEQAECCRKGSGMSVKVIDRATYFGNKPSNKQCLLEADMREILERRIEFSELTEFPYSLKTSLVDITSKARKVFAVEYYKRTGKYVNSLDDIPLLMTKITDDKKQIHIYCHFILDTWDRMIEGTLTP